MLQSLAEKKTTYTQRWTLRRVVFEPEHRYLFYSETLEGSPQEQRFVQDACAKCEDVTTRWKHKFKVVRVTREVDVSFATVPNVPFIDISADGFDVRDLFVLRVEGFQRKIKTHVYDSKVTTAFHAAYDVASPHRPTVAKPWEDGTIQPDDEDRQEDLKLLSAENRRVGETSVLYFRFLSEGVFLQWYRKLHVCLERDGLLECHCFDAPEVDPRFGLRLASVPLHLLNPLSALEKVVFYCMLKATRVLLNERRTQSTAPNETLPVVHVDSHAHPVATGHEDYHVLRYQEATEYHDATYVVLTDTMLLYLRRDSKVISILLLADIVAVYFNTTAEEPFVVFITRKPLAHLVLLFHPGSLQQAIYDSSVYHDVTEAGSDGVKVLVQCLEKLAPSAAATRLKWKHSLLSAPALKQKLSTIAPVQRALDEEDDGKPFLCIGVNVFGSVTEFLEHEWSIIRWKRPTKTKEEEEMPRPQVSATMRSTLSKLSAPSKIANDTADERSGVPPDVVPHVVPHVLPLAVTPEKGKPIEEVTDDKEKVKNPQSDLCTPQTTERKSTKKATVLLSPSPSHKARAQHQQLPTAPISAPSAETPLGSPAPNLPTKLTAEEEEFLFGSDVTLTANTKESAGDILLSPLLERNSRKEAADDSLVINDDEIDASDL